MVFTEFLECVKRAGLEGKFQYKEEWFDWNKNKIQFKIKDNEFIQQTITEHLYFGYPVLRNKYGIKDKDVNEFKRKSFIMHGNKYIYDKVNYVDNNTKVCIICKEHGEFNQTPSNHLRGKGCKKCAIIKTHNLQRKHKETFIKQVQNIHKNGDKTPKYIYTEVDYKKNDIDVIVVCPIHGEFKVTPSNHLKGEGCPKCRYSKLENNINIQLENNKINFTPQKKFEWLIFQSKQKIDFFLNEYNIGIECQGMQHFEQSFFQNKEDFNLTIERDINKFKLCQKNGVKLLYLFPKEKVDFSKVNEQYEIYKPNGNIFYSPEELIEYIKSQPKIKNLEE